MTISRNLSFLAEGVSSTGVLGASNGGSGASTLTGYLYGNGTSAFTASTTIPTSALSGTISNAQLANSSLTVNGTSISLGGSGTVTAAAGTLTGTTLNSTVVSSSLTSVGTLTSGTWNASTIGAIYGGTGQNTVTTGDLLYGSATNTWSKLGIGSTGTILRVVGGVPAWGTDYTGTVTNVAASVPSFLSISGSPITTSGTLAITYSGTALPIANGGTAQTSFTANQVLYGSFSQSANLTFSGTQLSITGGLTTSGSFSLNNTYSSANNYVYCDNTSGNGAVLWFRQGRNVGAGSVDAVGLDCLNAAGSTVMPGIIRANPLLLVSTSYLDLYGGSALSTRIFASGGVSIGNTTDPGAGNLRVSGMIASGGITSAYVAPGGLGGLTTHAGDQTLTLWNSATSGTIYLAYFGTGSPFANCGSITYNGSVTSYNTTSDRRLKTNITSLTTSGEFIDSLLPRTFNWISNNQKLDGFIADELQNVSPTSVTGNPNEVDENNNPKYQAIDASNPEIIANIVAELQSLRARLKSANIP